jgi:Mg2+/Co2+ transporter CorB
MSRPTKNITEEQKKEAKRLARKKYVLKNKTKVAKQISDWKENNKRIKYGFLI